MDDWKALGKTIKTIVVGLKNIMIDSIWICIMRIRLSKHIGIYMYIFGIIFNLVESLYFGVDTYRGFNITPQSIPEFICDGISLSLMMSGLYLMASKFVKEYKTR